jgi:hypothetical protein
VFLARSKSFDGKQNSPNKIQNSEEGRKDFSESLEENPRNKIHFHIGGFDPVLFHRWQLFSGSEIVNERRPELDTTSKGRHTAFEES